MERGTLVIREGGTQTGRMSCALPNLSRLPEKDTAPPEPRPEQFFLAEGDDGWTVVQEPFRRLEVARLLAAERRVLLAHTGGGQYEPSLNVVTDCRPAANRGTGPRWVVRYLCPGEGSGAFSDLYRQVPLSTYLVTAR